MSRFSHPASAKALAWVELRAIVRLLAISVFTQIVLPLVVGVATAPAMALRISSSSGERIVLRSANQPSPR
jgi:hypothetical protein